MAVNISFLGAVQTVTGSKYLVEHGGVRMLIDCGLFQGYKPLRERNWRPLPIVPGQIHAVLLTHAHLDHSGYLPLLAREGFRGRVHATPGTRDLCAILLPDSGHLQEEDAAFANRHGYSKHQPALPLYTRQDALDSLRLFHTTPFFHPFEPARGWRATFIPAGHIIGAASLLLEVGGRRILFSGDLGRTDDLVMKAPADPPAADTLLIESTYGDRRHPEGTLLDELAPALRRVARRGGVAVVPVFAVGRAQTLLHAIATLKAQKRIPHGLPVYLDSPMAIHSTEVFIQHPGSHRLSADEVRAMTRGVHFIETPEQSKAVAAQRGPMIILAASGMATGGRVLHHLAHYAGDHRNMIILTGYQTPGTRGARLAAGETSIRIHGQDVWVAAEVVQLRTASSHADAEQLLAWLRRLPEAPQQVYVVHGEIGASDALRERIEHQLHWRARVPEHGSVWPA